MRAAGLLVLGLSEPRPDAALVAANPDLEDCTRLPYFVAFDAGRQTVDTSTSNRPAQNLIHAAQE